VDALACEDSRVTRRIFERHGITSPRSIFAYHEHNEEAGTKRILGVYIVGADASEMISEAALAIEMGAFLDDLAGTIHPHPTLSEGLLESVDAALGQAIHTLNKGQ